MEKIIARWDRTVEKVAREIQNSDKATQREKDYAENILKELAK